jgi:hypothetical protein
MPRKANIIPAGVQIADRLSFTQITRIFPLRAIHEALEKTNKTTVRVRELPNEFMVLFTILLAVYRYRSQKEVLRTLADGLHAVFGFADFTITGASGISQARTRVGHEPLKELFEQCAIPLAKDNSIGCFYQGLRLVGIDGSSVDLEDNSDNRNHFGNSSCNGSPLVRLSGLVEIGTRAFFCLATGPWKGSSENSLALQVLPKLRTGMLCLGDRYYAKFSLIQAVIETGAHLLFRRQENWKLKREQVLPDGSYISTVYEHADKTQLKGIKVRVVEFRAEVGMDGKTSRTADYTLVTTLMDHRKYQFMELVNLYRERWEFETALDEMKTHLMGGQPLRSKTPELVTQEIYGMVLAHYVVRAAMFEAAESEKLDPDRLSFEHSKTVLERHLPKLGGSFPPSKASGTN